MKKIAIILLTLVFLVSCREEGEIVDQSDGYLEVNGKQYKFIQIRPVDGHNGVWILVPRSADVKFPVTISASPPCGLGCVDNTTVSFIE